MSFTVSANLSMSLRVLTIRTRLNHYIKNKYNTIYNQYIIYNYSGSLLDKMEL